MTATPEQGDTQAIPTTPLAQHIVETCASAPEWPLVAAETTDDPACTIDSLTAEERAKIRLRYVAVAHTDENRTAIGQRMGATDYYLSELVLDNDVLDIYGDRTTYDIAVNMAEAGYAVVPSANDAETGAPSEYETRTMDSSYAESSRIAQAAGAPRPIYRSFDADPRAPAPPELLDRFPTIGDVHARCDSLLSQKFTDNFYIKPNEALLNDAYECIELLSAAGRERERAQVLGISTIIANAVRRHPERDEVHFSIMIGASHLEGHAELTENPDIHTDPIPSPMAEPAPALSAQLLERATRTGEMPSHDELERVLLCDYLERTAFPKSKQEARAILYDYVAQLASEDVGAALAEIEALKHAAAEKTADQVGTDNEQVYNYLTATNAFGELKKYAMNLPGMAGLAARIQQINEAG